MMHANQEGCVASYACLHLHGLEEKMCMHIGKAEVLSETLMHARGVSGGDARSEIRAIGDNVATIPSLACLQISGS